MTTGACKGDVHNGAVSIRDTTAVYTHYYCTGLQTEQQVLVVHV